jgi:lipopolysaccharide transport system permease protein
VSTVIDALDDVRSQADSAGIPRDNEATAPLPVAILEPSQGWHLVDIRELWRFRELLYFLTWRDIKVRYKQTALGAAWALLQPFLMMLVLSIFFGRMAHVSSGGQPYALFAFSGLLPWTYFATAIAGAGNSVIGSERLITKIYFPRLIVPFAAIGAALVDFIVAFCLLALIMAYYKVSPSITWVLLPPITALITVAAMGIGSMLAALNVAYRDFRYVIPFFVQFGMFATPTVYMQPGNSSSPWLQAVLILNPMTSLIAAFRAAALGSPIHWVSLAAASAFVLTIGAIGCLYFRKVEDTFADII